MKLIGFYNLQHYCESTREETTKFGEVTGKLAVGNKFPWGGQRWLCDASEEEADGEAEQQPEARKLHEHEVQNPQ